MKHVVHGDPHRRIDRISAYRSSGGDTQILNLTRADRSTGSLPKNRLMNAETFEAAGQEARFERKPSPEVSDCLGASQALRGATADMGIAL
jgi:hypothetical protein